ncbi:ATP-grasp domain-containing protein [Salinicoccus albus]|uniref:ATP-grasp domain-containing protein n=1 Tax=Salinicoccus albus TaxID=418756 RepID=UPI00036F9A3C|nr:ATP-grasp domain-containing protein [Salinicoccus albus]
MKNSDLEYLFTNIPQSEANVYPHDIEIENIRMLRDSLQERNLNYETEQLDTGFLAVHLLRQDGTKIASVRNPYYPTNSRFGYNIVRNKYRTEQSMRAAEVPTTKSRVYKLNQKELAKAEAGAQFEGAFVIKPLNLALSKGVYSNVTYNTFDHYWDTCAAIIRKNKRKGNSILIQEYIEGFEVRVTIMEGRIVSIMTRTPGYVKGDGKHSIDTLIDRKNEKRMQCGFLKNYPIRKDRVVGEFLNKSGYTFSSIPKQGEYVLLLSVSNLINGGEVIDISALVSEEIKETALDALAAIPGMHCGGIDIMIKNFGDVTPKVIEVNAFPLLSVTKFPTYGTPSASIECYSDAMFVRDRYLNDVDNGYKIDNEKEILSHYLSFHERRNRLLVNQFKNLDSK